MMCTVLYYQSKIIRYLPARSISPYQSYWSLSCDLWLFFWRWVNVRSTSTYAGNPDKMKERKTKEKQQKWRKRVRILSIPGTNISQNSERSVATKRYQAVGFPYNRMLKLSSSRGIRIDVPVLSVWWSFVDHSVIIQALRKGLIEHEAGDTGGVSRWKSSCPDRLAEATISRYSSGKPWEACGPLSPTCK